MHKIFSYSVQNMDSFLYEINYKAMNESQPPLSEMPQLFIPLMSYIKICEAN